MDDINSLVSDFSSDNSDSKFGELDNFLIGNNKEADTPTQPVSIPSVDIFKNSLQSFVPTELPTIPAPNPIKSEIFIRAAPPTFQQAQNQMDASLSPFDSMSAPAPGSEAYLQRTLDAQRVAQERDDYFRGGQLL